MPILTFKRPDTWCSAKVLACYTAGPGSIPGRGNKDALISHKSITWSCGDWPSSLVRSPSKAQQWVTPDKNKQTNKLDFKFQCSESYTEKKKFQHWMFVLFCFYLGWLTVELSTDSEQGSLVNPHRTMSSTYAMFMHPYCPDRESNPGLLRDRRGLWHCTTCLASTVKVFSVLVITNSNLKFAILLLINCFYISL